MNAIEAVNLTRTFGPVTAVDNLTLSVRPGELFGLIGPDGAGKTTTMRMLASILDPTAGECRILGRHTVREAEAVKLSIGYMSQRFGLYPDLTVGENIDFYADLFGLGRKERAGQVERLLAFSNLAPFRNRRAGNLSGGMKQKLGLACALVHTPGVLLLDEPTNGVDPVSRRDFWRILHQLLSGGVTIFVTTAYLDEADRCHRVGLMHQGRLLACDTPVMLKGLMAGSIVEIITPQARKGASVLREAMPGGSVGLFGDRIHLVAGDAEKESAAAAAVLARAGVAVEGIRTVEPALEDVFVAAIGKRL